MPALRVLFACVVFFSCVASASAETLEAPIGGKPIPLGGDRQACAAPGGGWSFDATTRTFRPPAAPEAIGQAIEVPVAKSASDCTQSTDRVTLIATGRWPQFDSSSIVFGVDDERLDARGRKLRGVILTWEAGTNRGSDTCTDPDGDANADHCSWATGRDLPADPTVTHFSWLPAGARAQPDAILFDGEGVRAKGDAFVLLPTRFVIRQMFVPDAAIDLSSGHGEIPLAHPEAVSSADCGDRPCEIASGKVWARADSSLINTLEVKLRLRPHVILQKGDTTDQQPSAKLRVLHCPMTIVSGPPVRGNDDAKIVVKLEGGCARDVSSLRFALGNNPLKVLETVSAQNASYVLLFLGSIVDDSVAITAYRGQTDVIALAYARSPTRATPAVRATIELPGFPNLNFVPNNRDAFVRVSKAGEQQHFALLPIEGVYTVAERDGQTTIRGDLSASGMTGLRFGIRGEALPAGLEQVDLAVISDPLQRAIHEANVPAPIGASAVGKKPLIEMLCGGGPKGPQTIEVGVTAHVDFELRDTCRIVFHRERLSLEYGTQKLNFEIDVSKADGSARGDAHVAEQITFRAGPEPRLAWIHGVADPFDRVTVRVSHEADEAHYIGASEIKTGAAAAMWSVVFGGGRVRLYATTTIPTGLYRLSDKQHSGVLSLNFGVISRLTWLNPDGQEGVLGAEGGVLVMGLASPFTPSSESNTVPATRIGAVVGLGISVPIANRSAPTQAAIALHGWFEVDLTRSSSTPGGYTAFVFGPSITIGNVGTNL